MKSVLLSNRLTEEIPSCWIPLLLFFQFGKVIFYSGDSVFKRLSRVRTIPTTFSIRATTVINRLSAPDNLQRLANPALIGAGLAHL